MAKRKLSDPEIRAKLISILQEVRSEWNAYHVISSKGGWIVVGKGSVKAARRRFNDESCAIEHAKELAQRSHADLIVHSRDGRVREQVSFE